MFRIETLANRVILKPKIETQTKSGIVITRDARSQAINTDRGEVVMIGPAAWEHLDAKPDIKPGDMVYYSHYGAKTIKPEGSEHFYILCNDVDVLVSYTEEVTND